MSEVGEKHDGAEKKDAKSEEVRLPQKRYFRQRAHVNPLSDRPLFHPETPSTMNWGEYYPEHFCENSEKTGRKVEVLDVGCGYGGLLMEMSKLFPEKLSLGFEIRDKVSKYVQCRIKALRAQEPGNYQNVACIRTNAMKYMLNFFNKGQLSHMFFLFPDPHFKKKKHKWRVVNPELLNEYAFVMAEGGVAYTLTDVDVLHEWMKKHFSEHPLFEPIKEEELKDDPVLKVIWDSSEEGKKVSRNEGSKFLAVFRRIANPTVDLDAIISERPPAKRRKHDSSQSDDSSCQSCD